MKIKDIKISKQIRLTQVIIIILVLAIGLASFILANNLFINAETTYNHPVIVKGALSSIKEDILNIRFLMEEVVLLSDEIMIQDKRDAIELLNKDAMNQIDVLEKSYLGPRRDVETVKKLIVEYEILRTETVDLINAGKFEEASNSVRFDGISGVHSVEILNSVRVMEDYATNKATELYLDAQLQKNRTLSILIILTTGTILLISVILTLLRKNIIPPIIKLKDALDNFEQGKLGKTQLNISKNELGMISNSFNLMAARIEIETQEKIDKAAELLAAQKEIFTQAALIKTQNDYYIEKQLYQATLASIGDAVISCDTSSHIIFLNKVAERITGWTQEEAIGQHIENIFNIANEFTLEKSENIVEKAITSGIVSEMGNHTILINKDGIEIPVEDSAAPIFQEDGAIVGVVLVFRDVTYKRGVFRTIEYLSYHDELTGLYNRRFYEEELKRIDSPRSLPLTIVMGDVNGLKLVNDSLGHAYGDELLQKVSKAIKQGCRMNDIVARLGGDEFVILLPNTDIVETNIIINEIKNIALKEVVNCLPISISFGYATKLDRMQDIQEVFIKAEEAMYRQKLSESAIMKSKTVDLIMNKLHESNHNEKRHSIRVSELCEACAKKMNFDTEEINQIKLAGFMHDIGKIGIDEHLIDTVEDISNTEFNEIKRHPEIGYRILSSVHEFSEIANYVLDHHEQWDGKGYPKGLKGDEISIQGRIIAIANSFDSMVREGTYKQALSESEAINELRNCAGSQFDPSITEIFIEVILDRSSKNLTNDNTM